MTVYINSFAPRSFARSLGRARSRNIPRPLRKRSHRAATPQSPSPFSRARRGLDGEVIPIKKFGVIPAPPSSDQEAGAFISSVVSQQAKILEHQTYNFEALRGASLVFLGKLEGLGLCELLAAIPTMGRNGKIAIITTVEANSRQFYAAKMLEEFAGEFGIKIFIHTAGLDFFELDPQGKIQGIIEDNISPVLAGFKSIGLEQVDFFLGRMLPFAIPGALPGTAPIFVPEVDLHGQFYADPTLFQWQLDPVSEQTLQSNRHLAGVLAPQFAQQIIAGRMRITPERELYVGHPGTEYSQNRDPQNRDYGLEGAFSGALAPGQDALLAYVTTQLADQRNVRMLYYPSAAFLAAPGGRLRFEMHRSMVPRANFLSLAHLGLLTFHTERTDSEPHARLDHSESMATRRLYQTAYRNLTNDPQSPYEWRKWLSSD